MPSPLSFSDRLRVLLVDDNPDDLYLIKELTKAFTYPVDIDCTSTLALGALFAEEHKIEVAVIDLNLTESKGLDTLKLAKQLIPHVAIVILTGDSRGETAIESLKYGAQDFLVKGQFDEVDFEKSLRFARERHLQNKLLEERRQQLDFMLSAQSTGLVVLDEERHIIQINAAAIAILEIEDDMTELGQLPDKNDPEYNYVSSLGNMKSLDIRITRTNWNKQDVAILNIVDLTPHKASELKAAENLKLETVSRVCYGVAHEFNNLLAITRTKTDFLETLCQDDIVWRAHIQDLKLACNRGTTLVQKLMTFYGKKHTLEGPVSLTALLLKHRPYFETLCTDRIALTINTPDAAIYCDIPESSLMRILRNLVTNSIDAMPGSGSIEIEVATNDFAHLEPHVSSQPICISVKDNGRGISAEYQSRIFDPFFTTNDKITGRGLGLSVVSNILREHDGWIEFESEEESGTTFRAYLPQSKSSKDKLDERQLKRIDNGVSKNKTALNEEGYQYSVLVVDDESIIRFSVERLLESKGYNVKSAENAEVALSLLNRPESEFDLLITDLNMPGMNGKELANQALYMKEDLGLLIMSGFGSSGIDDTWLKKKNASFLAKPFSLASLLEAIQHVLERRNARQYSRNSNPVSNRA